MTNPEPIIVPDFDDVCDRLFEHGELSPNSDCMRLLRQCIHDDEGGYSKRGGFEEFSSALNAHPDRNMLISEIVGSWYHSNYNPMLDEYQSDWEKGETDPAFFLRYRREDNDDPLRLRKHPPAAEVFDPLRRRDDWSKPTTRSSKGTSK